MLNTPLTLPDEILARAATAADALAIAQGVAACELAETGKAETVPEDVLGWWKDTGVCLETDTYLLLTKAGVVIGYSGIYPRPDTFMLDVHTHVHPAYQGHEFAHVLLGFALERAYQWVQADPRRPQTIRALSFQSGWTDRLRGEGYAVLSSDWRLEIELHEAPPPPASLEGIVVRPYRPGNDEPAIHAVVNEAFSEIGGHPARSFEEWSAGVLGRASFDASLLYVALAQERIVGAILCRTYPEMQQGHINQLAVLRPWRRRGIALHLLSLVFGEYSRRGMTNVILDVDAHNATGAHQLYQRAGLRKIQQIDHLQKALG